MSNKNKSISEPMDLTMSWNAKLFLISREFHIFVDLICSCWVEDMRICCRGQVKLYLRCKFYLFYWLLIFIQFVRKKFLNKHSSLQEKMLIFKLFLLHSNKKQKRQKQNKTCILHVTKENWWKFKLTLKASLALLWGCLNTTYVRKKQTTAITLSTDTDQGADPPWTATMLKTQNRTPGGAERRRETGSESFQITEKLSFSFPWAVRESHREYWCKCWLFD